MSNTPGGPCVICHSPIDNCDRGRTIITRHFKTVPEWYMSLQIVAVASIGSIEQPRICGSCVQRACDLLENLHETIMERRS